MRLANKVAVITGAASGIGLATAEKFAAEGAIVMVCDLNQAGVDAAVKTVADQGGKAEGYIVDVTNKEQINAMRDAIPDENLRADVDDALLHVMTWRRASPTLAMMAASAGWSDAFVDQLFIAAAGYDL